MFFSKYADILDGPKFYLKFIENYGYHSHQRGDFRIVF
jgi:hypothetical protein